MKKLTIKEFGDIDNIFEVLRKNDEFFEALVEKKLPILKKNTKTTYVI